MDVNLGPPQSFSDAIWTNGLEPELIGFIHSLNWFYIIMFMNIIYGLKHTTHFNWYENAINHEKISKYKTWISAVIIAIVFVFFRIIDPTLSVEVSYISSLCRSIFIAVIFSEVFVDIPGFAIKRLKDFLEPKSEEKKEKKKE